MLIRHETWEKIRSQFTEVEKKVLRAAVNGETICPRGWTFEDSEIPEPLLTKLKEALRG